jgi:uncharacterized protein
MRAAEILRFTSQRPYPLPRRPWIMRQNWHELLFAHWPCAPQTIRPLLPACLELDLFEREAWVGVVPFHMSGVRPRGVPSTPGLSAFPELNVRTYVVKRGIPGVYFFSLDAGNPIAVTLARSLFHLPYFNARMSSRTLGEIVHYASQRVHRDAPSAEFRGRYRPIAPVVESRPGSLEAWLTERYALYTTAGSQLYRGDIHHAPWPLQLAEMELERNTMTLAHGFHLPEIAPLLHYAHRQDVLIWPLLRIPTHA